MICRLARGGEAFIAQCVVVEFDFQILFRVSSGPSKQLRPQGRIRLIPIQLIVLDAYPVADA